MQTQPGQFQYVVVNNTIYPVQYRDQNQSYQNVSYETAPQVLHFQPPPPQQIPDGRQQPLNVLSKGEIKKPMDEYTHKVLCYTITYLFFFIGCIGIQYGLYGSLTAARLWISSYVFLIITLIIFFVIKKLEQNLWKWILLGQGFFLILSFILEIAAFAMAVSHPVLFDYQKDFPSYYPKTYNNRRILDISYTSGTYTYRTQIDDCELYYSQSSSQFYEANYGYMCDPLLGRSVSSSDYSKTRCIILYKWFTYNTYQNYYSNYCDSYLNESDQGGDEGGNTNGSSSGSGSSYSLSGNLCSGTFDPLTDYCYPLQYAMMAYAVINFIVYLMLFKGLSYRIYQFYKCINGQQQIEPMQIQQGQTIQTIN